MSINYDEVIEVATAKERFMGNYGLFSKFLFQFPDRSLYGDLEKQIGEGDVKTAFETAHTMKGITANLSLQKVLKPLNVVVEALRAGNIPEDGDLKELKAAYDETVSVIRELKEEGTPLF